MTAIQAESYHVTAGYEELQGPLVSKQLLRSS